MSENSGSPGAGKPRKLAREKAVEKKEKKNEIKGDQRETRANLIQPADLHIVLLLLRQTVFDLLKSSIHVGTVQYNDGTHRYSFGLLEQRARGILN